MPKTKGTDIWDDLSSKAVKYVKDQWDSEGARWLLSKQNNILSMAALNEVVSENPCFKKVD